MEKNQQEGGEFLLEGNLCPGCREELTPADVEMFPYCPYCNYHFQNSALLEDFTMQPLLKRWVLHNCQQFLR